MSAGARTMKRLHLELGGKSAHVVLDDVGENVADSWVWIGASRLRARMRPADPPAPPHRLIDAYIEGVREAVGAIMIGGPKIRRRSSAR